MISQTAAVTWMLAAALAARPPRAGALLAPLRLRVFEYMGADTPGWSPKVYRAVFTADDPDATTPTLTKRELGSLIGDIHAQTAAELDAIERRLHDGLNTTVEFALLWLDADIVVETSLADLAAQGFDKDACPSLVGGAR
jgi:hypothetical protein